MRQYLLNSIALWILVQSVTIVDGVLCYQCTDCPEPFTENDPFVHVINNTYYRALCLKKTVHLGEGRYLISKGSVVDCPVLRGVNDIQIYCCNHDYCNTAFHISPTILPILSMFYLIV